MIVDKGERMDTLYVCDSQKHVKKIMNFIWNPYDIFTSIRVFNKFIRSKPESLNETKNGYEWKWDFDGIDKVYRVERVKNEDK